MKPVVNERALNVLNLIKKAADGAKPGYEYNDADDQPLARKIAGQSMVLLKNDGSCRSKKEGKIAVIGDFCRVPEASGRRLLPDKPHQDG